MGARYVFLTLFFRQLITFYYYIGCNKMYYYHDICQNVSFLSFRCESESTSHWHLVHPRAKSPTLQPYAFGIEPGYYRALNLVHHYFCTIKFPLPKHSPLVSDSFHQLWQNSKYHDFILKFLKTGLQYHIAGEVGQTTRLSKMVLTPQAPGSGTCSFFNLSPSTYALLPAFASKSFVAIAASPAALFAVEKLYPELRNVSTKAERGSTRVRDGGRARVYVYNLVRAELSASPHTCGVTLPPFNALAWRPCAKAEKKILASM